MYHLVRGYNPPPALSVCVSEVTYRICQTQSSHPGKAQSQIGDLPYMSIPPTCIAGACQCYLSSDLTGL